MAYQDVGRLDQAIPLIETTLEKRTNQAGGESRRYDRIHERPGSRLLAVGSSQASDTSFEATLEKVRATLGEDHTDTITIIDNLAVACAADGLHDRAIALHKTAISRYKATLGEDDLTTLVAINNLARAYQGGGQLSNSIELYVTVLAKLRTKLSDDHPTTLSAMGGLARSYQLAGQVDQAIIIFESTLKGRRTKPRPRSPRYHCLQPTEGLRASIRRRPAERS